MGKRKAAAPQRLKGSERSESSFFVNGKVVVGEGEDATMDAGGGPPSTPAYHPPELQEPPLKARKTRKGKKAVKRKQVSANLVSELHGVQMSCLCFPLHGGSGDRAGAKITLATEGTVCSATLATADGNAIVLPWEDVTVVLPDGRVVGDGPHVAALLLRLLTMSLSNVRLAGFTLTQGCAKAIVEWEEWVEETEDIFSGPLNASDRLLREIMFCMYAGHLSLDAPGAGEAQIRIDPRKLYARLSPPADAPLLSQNLPALAVTLRKYQSQAVRWMVDREEGSRQAAPSPFWQRLPIEPGTERQVWYCHVGACVTMTPSVTVDDGQTDGGILADEMGLGKTVETLSLILARPNPALASEREACAVPLLKVEPTADAMSDLGCVCPSEGTATTDVCVQCVACLKWLHCACIGVEAECEDYVCPWCTQRPDMPLVPSGATLIVCPRAILEQWHSELCRHVAQGSSLRIAVYEGIAAASAHLQKPGPPGASVLRCMNARYLAEHDVILTTYATLAKDLHHLASTADRSARPGTNRYKVIPSPLTRIRWWRICMDEAQMVGSSTVKSAKLLLQLTARYRWCVTGTPIQRRGASDLKGLLMFLRVPLLSSPSWFNRMTAGYLADGDEEAALDILADCLRGIFWRNSKETVKEELGLPDQVVVTHRLKFEPVEAYFYKRQHQRCTQETRELLGQRQEPPVAQPPEKHAGPSEGGDSADPIDVDSFIPRPVVKKRKAPTSRAIEKLLMSLLELRQTCCHPQLSRKGRNTQRGANMRPQSMAELLESLVCKARVECEEAQRFWVCSQAACAALLLIRQDVADAKGEGGDGKYAIEAADIYRTILRTVESHSGSFRLDVVQQIHVLHNLALVLGHVTSPSGGSVHRDGRYAEDIVRVQGRSLRDDDLLESAEEARAKYRQRELGNYKAAAMQLRVDQQPLLALLGDISKMKAKQRRWWETVLKSPHMGSRPATLVSDLRSILIAKRSVLTDMTEASRRWRLASSLAHRFKSPAQLSALIAGELHGLYAARDALLVSLAEIAPSDDPAQLRHQVQTLISCSCHSRTAALVPSSADQPQKDSAAADAAEGDLDDQAAAALAAKYHCDHCHLLRQLVRYEKMLYTDTSAKKSHDGEPAALMSSRHDSDLVTILKATQKFAAQERRRLKERRLQAAREARRRQKEAEEAEALRKLQEVEEAEALKRLQVVGEAGEPDEETEEEVTEDEAETAKAAEEGAEEDEAAEAAVGAITEEVMDDVAEPVAEEAVEHSDAEQDDMDIDDDVDDVEGSDLTSDEETDEEIVSEPSAEELLLQEVVAAAGRDLQLVEMLQKELKSIRRLWEVQRHQLLVADEVEQAVTRIRLITPMEEAQGVSEHERLYKIQRHEVAIMLAQNRAQASSQMAALTRHVGQLKYLTNLQRRKLAEQGKEATALEVGVDGEPALEECAICREPLGDLEVGVLACGHEFCCDCITDLIMGGSHHHTLRCPTCRYRMNVEEVGFVMAGTAATLQRAGLTDEEVHMATQVDDIEVKGSWGTKITAMVKRVLWIVQEEEPAAGLAKELSPGGKIVIFSQWQDVLTILKRALADNSVATADLMGSAKQRKAALASFRTLPQVRVLLLPIKSGSKGLNLMEARHVFMTEPILNPAAHQQAVGRVHRIGQTQVTFVHHFVVLNTVEESIMRLMEDRLSQAVGGGWGASKSEKECLTLDDLRVCLLQEA